tara:strand:+ start:260 stop:766 length:507 start_codon:yes stop_codon:yes gene_type:complete
MGTFRTNKTFIKHDDYMTPKYAWENIKHLIPEGKIWEGFYGDGTSGKYLTELGFDTIHEPIDFFDDATRPDYDTLVSNIPFSQSKHIIKKLRQLDKPFIILMPTSKINSQYFRENFKDKIQIIIPTKRIHFTKLIDGKVPDKWKNACFFDCFYYCYKINLPNDITWLE